MAVVAERDPGHDRDRGLLEVNYHGPRAALRRLAELGESGGLISLSRLVALDWESFVRSPRRDEHYWLAGFFVRYLLAGERGALAPRFRGYLAAVAAGGPAGGDALIGRLERSWDALQWGFELWLTGEAAAEAGYVAGASGSSSRHAAEPSE